MNDRNTSEVFNPATDQNTYQKNIAELISQENSSFDSPDIRGENSVSGSTPDPESDDDVLRNVHHMGIATDADLDNPQELNMSQDVEDAERNRS